MNQEVKNVPPAAHTDLNKVKSQCCPMKYPTDHGTKSQWICVNSETKISHRFRLAQWILWSFKHADNSCQCGNSSSQVSIWPPRDPTYCRIKQRSSVCLWWIQDLCSCLEFHHVTSSPHHPKSNGRVEAAVKAYKSLIKKTEESGVDVLLALLQAVAKRLRHCIENSLPLPKTHLPLHKKSLNAPPSSPPFFNVDTL